MNSGSWISMQMKIKIKLSNCLNKRLSWERKYMAGDRVISTFNRKKIKNKILIREFLFQVYDFFLYYACIDVLQTTSYWRVCWPLVSLTWPWFRAAQHGWLINLCSLGFSVCSPISILFLSSKLNIIKFKFFIFIKMSSF